MKWFANLPSKPLDKISLVIFVILSLYGVGFMIQSFFLIWPIYIRFRDDVAGSDLAQDADAVWAVWQVFFVVAYLPIMAVICVWLTLYCVKLWKSV